VGIIVILHKKQGKVYCKIHICSEFFVFVKIELTVENTGRKMIIKKGKGVFEFRLIDAFYLFYMLLYQIRTKGSNGAFP
jgi:hypothetical protein